MVAGGDDGTNTTAIADAFDLNTGQVFTSTLAEATRWAGGVSYALAAYGYQTGNADLVVGGQTVLYGQSSVVPYAQWYQGW